MKTEIIKYAETLEAKVLRGEVNPLDAFIFLKKVEKASDEAKKRIQEMAITELEKYGAEAKNLKHRGATITLKNGPTRYDYSHIQQINELKERIKSLESRHKQAAKTDATMVDDNGEIIEPAIIKQGKQVINIKFD